MKYVWLCTLFLCGTTVAQYDIRQIKPSDVAQIKNVYLACALTSKNMLRVPQEITDESFFKMVQHVVTDGLGFVAECESGIIGVILAGRSPFIALRHNLKDLLFMVHPDYQGKGIGTALMTTFLDEVSKSFSDILRVELKALATNPACHLYRRFGFVDEGYAKNGKTCPDEKFGDVISMAWTNPNFIQK